MNQAFFEHAMKLLDEMTDEELFESLKKHGIDATIRQYPEPENTNEEIATDHLAPRNCFGCMQL